jgi:hypothetical protein
MKNQYEDRGDGTVAIVLPRMDGSIEQAIISTNKLARAKEFPFTWCVCEKPDGTRYVYGKIKRKNVYLHRHITNCPAGHSVLQITGHLSRSDGGLTHTLTLSWGNLPQTVQTLFGRALAPQHLRQRRAIC